MLSELKKQTQYGYALIQKTGLKSGTLYPILMRLTDRGLLDAKWEESKISGRPPRQSYQLTEEGQRYANNVLSNDPKSSNVVLSRAVTGTQ